MASTDDDFSRIHKHRRKGLLQLAFADIGKPYLLNHLADRTLPEVAARREEY